MEREVLEAIDELPFGVGKKLLIAFLQGADHASTSCLSTGSAPHRHASSAR